jgi:hypothetical protein
MVVYGPVKADGLVVEMAAVELAIPVAVAELVLWGVWTRTVPTEPVRGSVNVRVFVPSYGSVIVVRTPVKGGVELADDPAGV